MNALKNKVQLIGNLGTTPEIITLDDGKRIAKFSLATNETYKDSSGQKVTDTQWHNIIAWNNIASIVEQFLQKGSDVIIEGRLRSRSFDDKDGNKRYFTEIVCNELLMLGRK
ncbi:single-stranded DNA-binding protein [Tenacibaculum sp. C7A-26P2]|uniref:single-stranded DNA-binding protein n=1 Tax=Tenacibaculum sp. C7A-26P2 TaxID=3447504 RepID=UPI003F8660FE